MSAASRQLQVGAAVYTDFSGKITYHTIIERTSQRFQSQSGIGFRVTPLIHKSGGGWIDADWFEPAGKPLFKGNNP